MNLRSLLTILNPSYGAVFIFSNQNNREMRWTHSRAMLGMALDSILGSPREVFGQEAQREAWEEFRLDCFFLKFKGEYPDYCAIRAWRAWYREKFDEAIKPLMLPHDPAKYSEGQLLMMWEARMPAFSKCRTGERITSLIAPPPPRLAASHHQILSLARALFSALPPCQHPHESKPGYLWYCGVLDAASASSRFEDAEEDTVSLPTKRSWRTS
jgi:hypothetical protein